MDHLEEIRSRLPIETVVGEYLTLKKFGRNFKALCPFHSEKTPSFIISPDRGMAYCFGCHNGGDIFKFVQLIERVEFREAVAILAEKAGVKLSSYDPKKHEQQAKTVEINEAVTCFFEAELMKNETAKSYLRDRALSNETIRNFRIGFAPDSYDTLHRELQKQGFSSAEIVAAGLASQSETVGGRLTDRFRNRIIFPIRGVMGQVVAFGGRIIVSETDAPKYLNSPETSAYHKSFILFALDEAKNAIREAGVAVVVEGYLDVIASHQAGVKNVVASSGTAFTAEQAKLLARYASTIIFSLDADRAGREATKRAIEIALDAEVTVKIATVPNGKDPDECIRIDPEMWRSALANAVPVIDFFFTDALASFSPETIDGKKAIAAALLPIIKRFRSKIEQSEHLARLSTIVRIDQKTLWNELSRIDEPRMVTHQTPLIAAPKTKNPAPEALLLGLLMLIPDTVETVREKLIFQILPDDDTKPFYKFWKEGYDSRARVLSDAILDQFSAEEREKLRLWTLYAERQTAEMSEGAIRTEVEKLVAAINQKRLLAAQKELLFDLSAKKEDPEAQKEILARYSELLKLRSIT